MAESSKTKALKLTPESDNLSALSDCVLLQILSLLDIKEAAATSILCARWRNLFLSLPDVNLRFCINNNDASDSEHDRLFHHFISFANRVFQQRNNEPVRKIQLYVKHFVDGFQLGFESLLISAAGAISSYNVRYLEIVVEMDRTTTKPCSVILPQGIFSSESLVSLHLSLHSSEHVQLGWNVPEFVWLPNLKDLNLTSFRLVDEDCIQRLLHACPLLQRLVLIPRSLHESGVEGGVHVGSLSLSSPSLKCLILCWDEKVNSVLNVIVKSESLERLACCIKGQHKVYVDAPNLKSLCIKGHILEVHISQSLASINVAVILAEFLFHLADVEDMILRSSLVSKFFSRLQYVKALTVSENILKALCFCPPVMPTFRNLIKLELLSGYCPYFPRHRILQVLLNLFKSSPNLEVLTFSEVFDNYFGKDEEFDFVLPLIFVERLKVIEMSNFRGEELEFKLVEHLLKYGKCMEKIVLERQSWKSLWKHRKRILSFQKCSKNCQIVFRKT